MHIFQASISKRKIHGEGTALEARMYLQYLYYSKHNTEGLWRVNPSNYAQNVSPIDLNTELIKILKGEVER